jgi:hypothetical protein
VQFFGDGDEVLELAQLHIVIVPSDLPGGGWV